MAQVCRVCLEELTAERNYFHIYVDTRSSQILSQLNVCLPEMSLGLVKDPVICITCLSMLHLAYNFKQKCLANEVHLKRMLERVVPGKDFTLAEIVQISKHKVINNLAEDILDTKVGMRDFLKDMDAQMLSEIEKQECSFVDEMSAEEFSRTQRLNASDSEPQINNASYPEPQINNASYPEPQINNTSDPEPQINNASDYEPQIDNASDYEPQIKNASDQELQINYASEQEPQKRDTRDQEPQNEINIQVSSNMLPHVTMIRLPEFIGLDTVRLTNEKPIDPNVASQVSLRKASDRARAVSSKKTKGAHQVASDKIFPCQLCDYSSNDRPNLRRHSLTHTDRPILRCPYCNFRTLSNQYFRIHKNRHVTKGEIQETATLQAEEPKQTNTATSKERPFECESCGFATKTRQLLSKHKKVHLKKPEPQVNVVTGCVPDNSIKTHLECEVCKYNTKSRALFASHLEACGKPKQLAGENVEILSCSTSESSTTDKETPFGCIVCDYTTTIRSNLIKHMRRHKNSPKSRTSRVLKKYEFVHCAESSELVNGA